MFRWVLSSEFKFDVILAGSLPSCLWPYNIAIAFMVVRLPAILSSYLSNHAHCCVSPLQDLFNCVYDGDFSELSFQVSFWTQLIFLDVVFKCLFVKAL